MAVKIAGRAVEQEYVSRMREWSGHLVEQVGRDGFISASATYAPYSPHWIRDASFVAMGLMDYSLFLKRHGDDFSEERDAAHRINAFHCKVMEQHMSSIRNALSLTLEDPEFFKLKNHIPARVGHDGNYYRDGKMDDSMQGEVRSGLIQHDSIPLALHALYREHKAFGLYESERRFLDGNMETLLKYLGKIYITECANMWEMETNVIHAYDVGAIYSAFRMAEELSRDGVISIGVAEIRDIENGLFRGGPLEFLKKFISDGVMYREKGAFQDSPYKDAGVDIAELYLFTLFGINDRSLGIEGIEAATIGEIDRTLFSSNVLPIRWHDDIYFCGGRWLNVGAEFSIYAADNGDIKRSRAIIDYIVGKYGSRLPEQEIVNPARPDVIDHYYVDNGYKVIDDLAWSYSSMLSATSHLLERMERESDRPEPRE